MIVSLAEAKSHLRVTDDMTNADVLDKLASATALVLDWLSSQPSSNVAWAETVASWGTSVGSPSVVIAAPLVVKAAVLEQLAELYTYRGDDPTDLHRDGPGTLSPNIKAKLYRLRPLVMA